MWTSVPTKATCCFATAFSSALVGFPAWLRFVGQGGIDQGEVRVEISSVHRRSIRACIGSTRECRDVLRPHCGRVQSALTASQANGQDDCIKIVSGNYVLTTGLTFVFTEAHYLEIAGGFNNASCTGSTDDVIFEDDFE